MTSKISYELNFCLFAIPLLGGGFVPIIWFIEIKDYN